MLKQLLALSIVVGAIAPANAFQVPRSQKTVSRAVVTCVGNNAYIGREDTVHWKYNRMVNTVKEQPTVSVLGAEPLIVFQEDLDSDHPLGEYTARERCLAVSKWITSMLNNVDKMKPGTEFKVGVYNNHVVFYTDSDERPGVRADNAFMTLKPANAHRGERLLELFVDNKTIYN